VPKKKLGARYLGLFCICNAISKQAYQLALPTSYCIHDMFYISLLELYRQRAGKEPADPILLADEESEWEVEAIRGKCTY